MYINYTDFNLLQANVINHSVTNSGKVYLPTLTSSNINPDFT